MIFWSSLVLNCLLFLVIINLGRWFKRRENPTAASQGYSVVLPITLGAILTILDSLRLAFFQQLALFIISAILAYWIFSIFLKK